MAKLRRSRYESGRRSPAWLKIKRRAEQEFVIGGWTPREGSTGRPRGAAGRRLTRTACSGRRARWARASTPGSGAGSWICCGRSPGPSAPFQPAPREKGARWVEPSLVARVEFAEWTTDGNLRAPSTRAWTIDADPNAVARERARPAAQATREARQGAAVAAPRPSLIRRWPRAPVGAAFSGPRDLGARHSGRARGPRRLPGKGGLWTVGGRELKLSNLDKVLWPADGITKRDLIRYYVAVAPYLLPYLRDRALTLQRYPDGIDRTGFWQKQVPGHAPDWVACWPWPSVLSRRSYRVPAGRRGRDAGLGRQRGRDRHPPFDVPVAAPDRPTWALIDIDPGATTTWNDAPAGPPVPDGARAPRRARLPQGERPARHPGLDPDQAVYTFDQTRDWVAALSRTVAAATPEPGQLGLGEEPA